MRCSKQWLHLLTCLLMISAAGWIPYDSAGAQTPTPQPIVGRYYVGGVTTEVERRAIARTGVTLARIGPDYVEIIATPAERRSIAALGFALHPSPRQGGIRLVDTAYHTYDEMVAEIHAVAAAHPQIIQLFSIGQSYEGHELWAAKISDNVLVDEAEPEALFVGLYHAREHLSVEMMLYILHMLVDEYNPGQSESVITRLVDTREIYLIFALNPDGGEYDIATGTYRYWRKNRQPNPGYGEPCIGTDLNRNHRYHWGNAGASADPCDFQIYRGPAPASAPEVAAIERFVDSRVISGTQQINVAISFHTFGELILWPYGYTLDDTPPDMPPDDQAVFMALGQAMAAMNQYTPQQASDLYQTSGDFADWAYGVHHIFAYTFEMYPCNKEGCPDDDFYPPGSIISAQTARNRAAVLYLLEQAACPYQAIGKAVYCTVERMAGAARAWLPLVTH